jgi:hypothetical protein
MPTGPTPSQAGTARPTHMVSGPHRLASDWTMIAPRVSLAPRMRHVVMAPRACPQCQRPDACLLKTLHHDSCRHRCCCYRCRWQSVWARVRALQALPSWHGHRRCSAGQQQHRLHQPGRLWLHCRGLQPLPARVLCNQGQPKTLHALPARQDNSGPPFGTAR